MAGERLVRVGQLEVAVDSASIHRSRVVSVALGPDFIVSGANDGSVMLLDRDCREGRFRPRRSWPLHHSGPVTFVQVCDRRIVTAGKDGKVCVWEGAPAALELGAVWRESAGAPVTALCAGHQAVIWAREDGRIFLGRPESQKPELLWKGAGSEVTALAVWWAVEEGSVADVVAGTSSGEVYWLGTAGPRLVERPLRPAGPIIALRWLGRKWIAVADRMRTWTIDLEAHRLIGLWRLPEISALGYSPNGRWAAVGTRRGLVRALDLRSPVSLEEKFHQDKVVAVQFATDQVFLTASRDGTVKLARIDEGHMQVLGGYPVGGQVSAMDVNDERVLVGLASGSLVSLGLHLPVAHVEGRPITAS
jgi:WD40 repeat protein